MFESIEMTGRAGRPRRHREDMPHGVRRGRWMRHGPGGFAGFAGRGPRVRRGDVRTAILRLLDERPMHGYEIIQVLSERSGGRWQPSAGSIYPTLQQLEDEGLVRAEERDDRRVFSLTDAGRELAKTSSARRPGPPWELGVDGTGSELRELIFQVGAATAQVAQVGSATAVAAARDLLTSTRRELYRLLAEDEGASGEDAGASGDDAGEESRSPVEDEPAG